MAVAMELRIVSWPFLGGLVVRWRSWAVRWCCLAFLVVAQRMVCGWEWKFIVDGGFG